MEIEIKSLHQFPSVEKDRLGEMDTLVIVELDGKRRDTFLFRQPVSDKKEIEKLVTEELKKRSDLIGHKFTVA